MTRRHGQAWGCALAQNRFSCRIAAAAEGCPGDRRVGGAAHHGAFELLRCNSVSAFQVLIEKGGYTYLDVRPTIQLEEAGRVRRGVNVPYVQVGGWVGGGMNT